MSDIESIAFGISSNVEITVKDRCGNIRQTVTKHNKCTRQMVSGILRYLSGHFTDSNINDTPEYDSAKNYIPCYFNVGEGGVEHADGYPRQNEQYPNIPVLSNDWDEKVDYTADSLVKEFFVKDDGTVIGTRSIIRVQDTSLNELPKMDMDSIYFYCEIPPTQINAVYGGRNVFITELGLFSGIVPGEKDLLTYVKLGNYTQNDQLKTNALLVKNDDTIVINWIISIAAIGTDARFKASYMDGTNPIETTIFAVPTVGNIEIDVDE